VPHVELELALVEVAEPADDETDAALRAILAAAGGEALPSPLGSRRARLAATPTEIDAALESLRPMGLRRLVRAGAVAMTTETTPPGETANGETGE
jgi:acetolactate synthase small subunit